MLGAPAFEARMITIAFYFYTIMVQNNIYIDEYYC